VELLRGKRENGHQFACLKFATVLFGTFCNIAHIGVHQESKDLMEQASVDAEQSSLGAVMTTRQQFRVHHHQLRLVQHLPHLTATCGCEYLQQRSL
jgi:hypothetical protein